MANPQDTSHMHTSKIAMCRCHCIKERVYDQINSCNISPVTMHLVFFLIYLLYSLIDPTCCTSTHDTWQRKHDDMSHRLKTSTVPQKSWDEVPRRVCVDSSDKYEAEQCNYTLHCHLSHLGHILLKLIFHIIVNTALPLSK